MSELSDFLKEVERSGEEFLALVEGEWVSLIWVSNAYDGSPYGAPGFANDGNYYIPEDIISEAKYPSEEEFSGLLSEESRIEEKQAQAEFNAQCKIEEDLQRKRDVRKARREEVESRYTSIFGKNPPPKITMRQMRIEINEELRKQSNEGLAKVFGM